MNNKIKDISLIFSENPIARAYLYLFLNENLISNKIIYLDRKIIFNSFFMKLKFDTTFHNTKRYLRSENVLKFIKIIKKFCIEKELLIKIDYRKSDINNLERFFYPTTNDLTFKVNRMFHNLIKGKKKITTTSLKKDIYSKTFRTKIMHKKIKEISKIFFRYSFIKCFSKVFIII